MNRLAAALIGDLGSFLSITLEKSDSSRSVCVHLPVETINRMLRPIPKINTSRFILFEVEDNDSVVMVT